VKNPPPARCPRCGALSDSDPAPCPTCAALPGEAHAESVKARRGILYELLTGVLYMPRGFLFILSNRRLWKLAIIPLAMNLALMIAAIWGADALYEAGTASLNARMEGWEGWLWSSLAVLTRIALAGLQFLSWVMAPLVIGFLFALFGKFLFMPFMEILSAQTEHIVLGKVNEDKFTLKGFSSDLVVAIVNAALLTFCQLGVMILLLPLHLVPAIGNLLWFIIPGALFAGMDYTDMNFIRRRYRFSERLATWKSYKLRFLGFGFAFFGCMALPWLNLILGCFAIPTASVGGTLLFLELPEKHNALRRGMKAAQEKA
jgi:CysZ protein